MAGLNAVRLISSFEAEEKAFRHIQWLEPEVLAVSFKGKRQNMSRTVSSIRLLACLTTPQTEVQLLLFFTFFISNFQLL